MARKKKKLKPRAVSAELNIMPFIDIFSMLNTFLLVSAAFINLGIVEVQIPFLANSSKSESKPKREVIIDISITKDSIELVSKYSAAPINRQKKIFMANDPTEIQNFHNELVAIRVKNPQSEKVTLYSEDDVNYQRLVQVLDQIKFLKKNDPPIPVSTESKDIGGFSSYLYKKVVIGNIIL